MLKQALKVATVLGVLVVAYSGYVRGFALLAERFRPLANPVALLAEGHESATSLRAKSLALEEFGSEHWTTKASATNLEFTDKNSRFYAGTYERKEGGKVFIFRPFAVISVDKGGKVQSINGKQATLTFGDPVDVTKPSGKPMRVVHAKVEGDVVIRDGKGTRDRSDDLEITGLTYLDYDEKDLTITSRSPMHLKDRDLTADALGVRIALRPPPETGQPGGAVFEGAQTIWLEKDVVIHIGDVGKSGILPGSAPAGPPGDKTPMVLTCDGEARFDLPEPPHPPQGRAPRASRADVRPVQGQRQGPPRDRAARRSDLRHPEADAAARHPGQGPAEGAGGRQRGRGRGRRRFGWAAHGIDPPPGRGRRSQNLAAVGRPGGPDQRSAPDPHQARLWQGR